MLDILAAVVQDALVGALVLLLEVLHAQDDGAGLSVGPGLEPAALALRGQVFEALIREASSFLSFVETLVGFTRLYCRTKSGAFPRQILTERPHIHSFIEYTDMSQRAKDRLRDPAL